MKDLFVPATGQPASGWRGGRPTWRSPRAAMPVPIRALAALIGALLVAAPALASDPSRQPAGNPPLPDERAWPPFIAGNRVLPDRVTVLIAVDAQRTGEFAAVPVSHTMLPLTGWKDARQALSWTIDVPEAGDYEVATVLKASAPVRLTVSNGAS